MRELTGKAALVTGGSRGIGAAIVRALAAGGAEVAFTYRQAADQAATVVRAVEKEGGRALAITADSGDAMALQAAVHEAAAAFGRLDILVNNAGIFPFGPPETVTVAEIDWRATSALAASPSMSSILAPPTPT